MKFMQAIIIRNSQKDEDKEMNVSAATIIFIHFAWIMDLKWKYLYWIS